MQTAQGGYTTSEFDVGPTPGHVGGYRDSAVFTRKRDNFSFFLEPGGVEDFCLQTALRQPFPEPFTGLHASGTHQQRLAGGVQTLNFSNYRLPFGLFGQEETIGHLASDAWSVRRNGDYRQAVNLPQFPRRLPGRAGHAGQFVKTPEKP